jgi:pilin isopeptide linkage protein/LPXTG-motif cell wall-anchored protein
MKRKISTYFSLLVIMASILISPLNVIAEMSSNETDPIQTTGTSSDNAKKVSESQTEEGASATNSSSEEVDLKKTESKKVQHSETIQSSEKQSRAPALNTYAAVDNVITSLSITDKNGNPLTDSVGQWETFRINGTFSLPNNQVVEGDTTTITLPSELRIGSSEAFQLKDSNGNIVANATILSSTKQIILTYTNYAETHSDVKGSFYFYAGVDSTVVKEEKTITTEIDVEGKTFPIEIDFAGIDNTSYPLTKSGWFTSANEKIVQYYIAINRTGGSYSNAKVVDNINSEAVTYVPGSFIIYKGQWQMNASGTDWELVNRVDVTANYTITLSDDNRSFSIDFGNIGDSDQYAIYYKAELEYTPVDGENIVNKAVLTSNDVLIQNGIANTNYQKGGGEAEGYNFTVSILKTNVDGEVLSGAEFEVVRNSTGQIVGKITTDVNGQGSIFNLLKDNYTIREIKSPDGYELLDEEIAITPDDFGTNQEATKNIVNKKIIKPVEMALEASKELTGKELSSGEFSFELVDEQGTVLQTKTNDATGKIYFDAIEYDEAGTYNYTIQEVIGSDDTITYDSTKYNVSVKVEDKAGQLVATPSYEGDAIFKNSYTPAQGSAVLEASKELTGKELSSGEFSFELIDEQGIVLQTKTNDATGKIYFDAIEYDEAGTYNYTIQEVIGSDDTITYDSTKYNVSVKVEDKAGQLVATPSYEGDAIFKNSYTPAQGSAVLEASKELSGKELSSGEFSFELVDEQGTVLQTKTNDATGKIYFDAIEYDEAGTYNYTIQEVAGSDSTITYDSTKYNVSVKVEDKAGQLVATPSYEGDAIFKNSYTPAQGSAVLEASKELTGKELSSGEFSFELIDEQGIVLQTKTNDATGKIYFDAIEYDEAGTYNYTIQEVIGSDDTITYDSTKYNVSVKVEDKAGQLVATPSYEGDAIFKNSYTPAQGSAVLEASKELTGKELSSGEFSFELVDEQGIVLQTKTNDATGKIYFDAIEYDEAGTYNYTIQEVAGSDNTITYDSTKYNVSVKVEDKAGQLVATPSYEGDVIFKNSYTPAQGSAVLEASKELTGKELSSGEFSFELVDEQGTVLQTKTNDATGKIYFDAIEYDEAGTYNYTIQELAGSDNTITYDSTKYNVSVKVEDKAGQLMATPSYEGDVIFKNSYSAPKLGKVTLKKVDSQTGELLANAKFELQDSLGNVIQKDITTNSEGKVTIGNLKIGEYQLVETKAPNGYRIDKTPIKFSINESSLQASKEKVLKKENDKLRDQGGNSLPKTGNSVNQIYMWIGLLCLVLFLGIILLKNKRSKN